jgi:hypothetical protein
MLLVAKASGMPPSVVTPSVVTPSVVIVNERLANVTKIGSALVVMDNVLMLPVVTPSGMPPNVVILLVRIIHVMANGNRISSHAIRINEQPSQTSVVTPSVVTDNGTSVSGMRLNGKAAGLLTKRPVIRKTGRTNPGSVVNRAVTPPNAVMSLVKTARTPLRHGRVRIASNVTRARVRQNNVTKPLGEMDNAEMLHGMTLLVMSEMAINGIPPSVMTPSGKRWLCRSNGNRHVTDVPPSGTCRCGTIRPRTTPIMPLRLRRARGAKTAW